MFRLVSERWETEILGARRANPRGLRIVCPFIKAGAIQRILRAGSDRPVQVITRFELNCFLEGVSDLEALDLLLKAGASVRGVKNLHAKLFIFAGASAVATSANVTDAGLLRNHEFGFVSDDDEVVSSCQIYFDDLWSRAGDDITRRHVNGWRTEVADARQAGGGGAVRRLPDHGVQLTTNTPFVPHSRGEGTYANQAFLKFFGRGASRTARTVPIADIVADSGCNWACTYPSEARPRQVQDGDILYMARISLPDDLLIYGYATGWRHRDEEDVAHKTEIAAQPWRAEFANYIRVYDGRFVNAALGEGVSMYEMLKALGSDSWRSTWENARSGVGNTDPWASYLRKPGMQLTDKSRAWIDERLQRLFRRHGEVDLSAGRFRPPR